MGTFRTKRRNELVKLGLGVNMTTREKCPLVENSNFTDDRQGSRLAGPAGARMMAFHSVGRGMVDDSCDLVDSSF
jgi:hypothetical protein